MWYANGWQFQTPDLAVQVNALVEVGALCSQTRYLTITLTVPLSLSLIYFFKMNHMFLTSVHVSHTESTHLQMASLYFLHTTKQNIQVMSFKTIWKKEGLLRGQSECVPNPRHHQILHSNFKHSYLNLQLLSVLIF